MSTIGSGFGVASLVGSAAGAQQSRTDSNGVKSAAAEQTFRIGQQEMTSRSLDSVGQSDVTPDRDADGRQAYEHPAEADTGQSAEPTDDQQPQPGTAGLVSDVFGVLGQTLDLEA